MWSIGICNPSGLQGKFQLVSSIDASVLAISETHLSKRSTNAFHASLRAMRSRFTKVLTGAPLPQRASSSDAGSYAGVAFTSSLPCRTLAVPWPVDAYETSRVQCAAFFSPAGWVTGAVLYGYPQGKTHVDAKGKTELLLDFLFDHLHSLPGPRFFAGDWNFEPRDLDVVAKLRAAGWVEAQDLFLLRTGAPIQKTCKGATRKDHLWLSPELALAFADLSMDFETFADHAVMVARFRGGSCHAERFVWPCPQPVPWSQVPSVDLAVDFSYPADPSAQYATLWQQREHSAQVALQDHWVPAMKGRGQQTEPRRVVGRHAPIKRGRSHDVQPNFHGFSSVHAQRFKQLRRLQNYLRWVVNHEAGKTSDTTHGIALWAAVLKSPGFAPSFSRWWPERWYVCPNDPCCIPQFCPPAGVAHQIFEAVFAEVRLFERRLVQMRAAHRTAQHAADRNLIFKEVARPSAEPVETLLHQVCGVVEEVDDQESAVILTEPVDVRPGFALWVGGSPKDVIHAEADKVWLADVDGIQTTDRVVQSEPVGDLAAIFEAFHTQWKQRWCRHDDTSFRQWDQLVGFASRVLRPAPIPHLQVDVDLLRAEVSRKKKTAATGLDGVSRQDLLLADDHTLQSLVNAFCRAEVDGTWPSQLLAGKVHSLAKCSGPSGVGDYRPITVFGLPYRAWSSLQSRHLLQWAETWVDDGVYGNRKGRQASDLWNFLLLQVEMAYSTGQPICGLSADLEKCFNCIPRFPALCLAVLAGTPPEVTTAWAGGLASMKRHFKVRESYSCGFLTSTGLAEGCGLSVYGMLLVDHLFHVWTSYQGAPCRSLSYVDDWHVFTWDVDFAVRQLDLVVEFASMLDLTVDRRKTVAWSTDAQTLKALRDRQIPVVHQARELGGHFGVSRQFTNKTVTQRLDALDDFWPKLRNCRARHAAKVHMLRAVAWPRGLHAIASAPIGEHVWTELRRRATHALACNKPGVNSHLLLGLVEVRADPQLVALLWTCRAARLSCDLDFWTASVACVAHGDLDLPPNSVASVLLGRLQHVGLHVDRLGFVHDTFGRFSIHQGNFAEVEMRLTWAWYQVVASKVQHRAEFHGLWQVDVPATRRALAALAPDDQALLRFGLTGGLFTEAYKAKWTEQADVCRWCGERDTLQHRYWECVQHADLRASHAADAAKVWTSLPPALSLRGWALLPPTWQSWISALAGLPTEVVPPSGSFRRGVWNDVFTDGSCLWQAQVTYRVASWAVVLAAPFQPSWTPEMAVVLHASALSGVCQTAFRAELAAVAYVLHWAAQTGTAVRIWSDCMGFVNRVKLMCTGRFRLGVNRPNSDLWIWIAASLDDLGVERVQIRKVAAHRTLQSARTAAEMWQFFHNGYVDKAARLANQARPEKFWKLWEQHVQATQTAQKLASQVQALHVAIGRRHVLTEAEAERVTDVIQRSTRQFEMQFSIGRWFGHALPDSSRLFGATHVTRVVQWFTERIRDNADGDLRWVSFAQLYLDFQMCWGLPGPLRVQNLWVDISMRPHLTITGFSFKQQVKWFRQLLKSVWKESSVLVAMEQCRPHSSMVQAFVQSASLPWAHFALHTVDNWLAENLLQPCTRNAGALQRLPAPPKCQEMAVDS